MKRTTNRVVKKPRKTVESRESSSVPVEKDADGWRIVGNDRFKEGNYAEAIDCYTESIACKATVVGYANRAMARLKLGEHESADADCTEALGLDPSFLKAYQRRAVAREALGRLEDAARDLEFAVRLRPKSETVVNDFKQCWERLVASAKLKPLRKRTSIPVRNEKQPKEPSATVVDKAAGPVVQHASQEQAKQSYPDSLQEIFPRPLRESGDRQDSGRVVEEVAVVVESGPLVACEQGADQLRIPFNDAAAPVPPSQPEILTQKRHESIPEKLLGNVVQDATKEAIGNHPKEPVDQKTTVSMTKNIPRTPKTSGEFEAAWKSLKSETMDTKSLFVSKIDLNDYQRVFKSGLSPPILLGLTTCALFELRKGHGCICGCDFWISALNALSGVSRFRMVSMCLGRKEKTEVKEMWAGAEAALEDDNLIGSLREVRKLYMV